MMCNQSESIARRIVELREILGMTPEDVAGGINLPVDEYLAIEAGEQEISISVLCAAADFFGVDPTELLTGEAPRMSDYTIVRGGKGVAVERYPGYGFISLASNFIGRNMEPLLVYLAPSETPPKLVRHGGQEFNYVIEGELIITVGSREFVLKAGDTIYFDPTLWHGQRALGGPVKFITVVNE